MRIFTSLKKGRKGSVKKDQEMEQIKITSVEFCRLSEKQVLEISSLNGYFDHNFYWKRS